MAQDQPGIRNVDVTSLTLIERVQARDEKAWRQLVTLYGPLVEFWIRRSGVRKDDCPDIFQIVFQAVAKSMERFSKEQPGSTFRGWLRTITRNKVVDFIRMNVNRPGDAAGGTDARAVIEQQQWPDDEQEDPTEVDAVRKLRLRGLEIVRGEFEGKTWDAFWRVEIEGQDVKDVAADLAVSASAVRLYKARILKRLREELGELESEE